MTDKVQIDRELLEAVAKCIDSVIDYSQRDFDHPPEPTTEWDFNAGVLVAELRAALNAPQQEAVAEVTNSGTGAVLYRDAHVEDGDLLYLHPAPSVPEGWQLVPKEPTPEMLDVTMFPQGAAQLYRAMLSAAPKAPTTDDRKDAEREGFYEKMWKDFVSLQRGEAKQICIDAERWRYIRRHLCLTGNGDGTCQMHALNLPCRIQGWPEIGESLQFHDAAIDAAIAAQKGEKE